MYVGRFFKILVTPSLKASFTRTVSDTSGLFLTVALTDGMGVQAILPIKAPVNMTQCKTLTVTLRINRP